MGTSVNMRDIARHAGVSVATVSKSLSNKKDISPVTKRRVLAACRKLGYKPNPLVSALMRTRRRHSEPASHLTLAFVTAFPTADGWRRHPAPIFRQMYAGAEARAIERNYNLEHFWLYRDGMSNRRFSEVLAARGIQGILLAPVPDTRTHIDLNWSDFAVVVLGLTPTTNQFHRVTTDYYQSMFLAIEECARRGYKRPGLAARLETIRRLEFRWEAAYFMAQEWLKLPPFPQPLFVEEWNETQVEDWLKREKPDVVIGPVHGKLDEIIRASGRKIPKDIGLVGLMVPHAGDRLSGILQDGGIIGSVAADQLISLIERNEPGIPSHPVTHTMLGHWNPGRTIAHRRKNRLNGNTSDPFGTNANTRTLSQVGE